MIGGVGQNSSVANIQATPAILTVPYTSMAGSTLVVFTAATNTGNRGIVSSVTDSNGVSWTKIVASGGGAPHIELWGIVNSLAITSVTVNFAGNPVTSAPYSAGVAEYSGVSAIINGTSVGNTGTTSPISITQTLTSPNNWIIAGDAVGVSGGTAVTISPNGNQRFTINTASLFGMAFGDNTATSNSPVEIDFNFTGAASNSFGLSAELQSTLPSSPANIISTARTASSAAASSTATPFDSGSITTWSLPGKAAQKLVDGTQSFSTQKGQLFTDFTQKNILATTTTSLSTQEGIPKQNS